MDQGKDERKAGVEVLGLCVANPPRGADEVAAVGS